jgi:hypothetical protein
MTHRILILVEGQTESDFVARVLSPWLSPRGIYPIPTIVETKRLPSGLRFKGGDVTLDRLTRDATRLLGDTDARLVTTLVDYYGIRLADDDPLSGKPPDALTAHLQKRINHPRFLPYVQVYDFEALLFADPATCCSLLGRPQLATQLQQIAASAGGPEHINDRPETCPSQRLRSVFSDYNKRLDGVRILERVGIPAVRSRCPRFDVWLTRLVYRL